MYLVDAAWILYSYQQDNEGIDVVETAYLKLHLNLWNWSRAMIIYDNNFLRFFESWIVVLFFVLTLMGLFGPFLFRRLNQLINRMKPEGRVLED